MLWHFVGFYMPPAEQDHRFWVGFPPTVGTTVSNLEGSIPKLGKLLMILITVYLGTQTAKQPGVPTAPAEGFFVCLGPILILLFAGLFFC